MKIVQLTLPPKEVIINTTNLAENYLYLRVCKDLPDAILTRVFNEKESFTWKPLSCMLTIGSYFGEHRKLKDSIESTLNCSHFKVLQFDTMKELMQYCLDHWK